ncbi:NAD(P)H-dependent oxidoreductase [Floricoccus penangensis]|uniref:NAD(P)H-dependent oxidoreductase n=1 Tax=Floricoccus penangensis TaxID=1859475 RepID=UPI00203AD948|nr:FMN-dependent NADH-azoreductase [Floricoccus penangensis]URZ88105.1 FMN-dependent NADH-azoreductase [Floricoccus penangensis]
MANVLAIKGHPLDGENSKSMKVFEEFLKTYEETNPNDEITVVELYNEDFPEIDLDIMSGWGALQSGAAFTDLSEDQQAKIARFNESTEQFVNADKVIVANGLWNLNIPTRLKAWFDTINVAGKTFKYTAEGPVGLADGKKVVHIQANGGVYGGEDPASQYVKTIFNFIGIDDLQQVFIEGADYDPTRTEEIINSAVEKAVAIAKEF